MTSWKCYTVEDTTLILYLCHRVLNFSRSTLQTAAWSNVGLLHISSTASLSFYGQSFSKQCHFETSASYEPKTTLNYKNGQKLSHVGFTATAEPPSFNQLCFTANPFRATGCFETGAPTWHGTLRGEGFPICILQLPMGLKFQSVLLYGQPLVGHFETSAPNDPKWQWTHTCWQFLHVRNHDRIRYYMVYVLGPCVGLKVNPKPGPKMLPEAQAQPGPNCKHLFGPGPSP